MESLVASDLTIEVRRGTAGDIHLDWKGKSNDRTPKRILGPFFDSVSEIASREKAPVTMHFETLEYLNSSTISALIGFIRQLGNLQVHLVITYAQELKWQKLCFDALRIFEKPDNLLKLQGVTV